jgi:hypothetical protein
MFIFKTAKVWRDLAGEDYGTIEDGSPSGTPLTETSTNTGLNEKGGAHMGTAPVSVRPGEDFAKD